MVKVVRKKYSAPKNLALGFKRLKKSVDDATHTLALVYAYLYGQRYYKAGDNWYRTDGAKVVIKKGLK